jgi:hypothetical protein
MGQVRSAFRLNQRSPKARWAQAISRPTDVVVADTPRNIQGDLYSQAGQLSVQQSIFITDATGSHIMARSCLLSSYTPRICLHQSASGFPCLRSGNFQSHSFPAVFFSLPTMILQHSIGSDVENKLQSRE